MLSHYPAIWVWERPVQGGGCIGVQLLSDGDERRSQREALALVLDGVSRHGVRWSLAILAEHWLCSPALCCLAPLSGIDASQCRSPIELHPVARRISEGRMNSTE